MPFSLHTSTNTKKSHSSLVILVVPWRWHHWKLHQKQMQVDELVPCIWMSFVFPFCQRISSATNPLACLQTSCGMPHTQTIAQKETQGFGLMSSDIVSLALKLVQGEWNEIGMRTCQQLPALSYHPKLWIPNTLSLHGKSLIVFFWQIAPRTCALFNLG